MGPIPFQNFTEDESGIVARLALDIPESADETLTKVKIAIGDIKVELEATNRFLKDFMTYLDKVPEISATVEKFQEQELSFLRQKLELSEKIAHTGSSKGGGGGSRGGGTGNPVSTDPRGNVKVDVEAERARRDAERKETQRQASYQGNTATEGDVSRSPRMQSMMGHRAQLEEDLSDPRQIFEHMRERGMVTEQLAGGKPSYSVQIGGKRFSADELLQNPALQSAALDQLAEDSAPGSGGENGSRSQRIAELGKGVIGGLRGLKSASLADNASGLGAIAKNIGGALFASGGGLTSLGTGLAIGGGALGIGALGLGAVEEGGQVYQGLKNLGQTHNQGAGGGLGYEMGMRMMALNPFITTEQSRQIMMGALNTGYTGKEFDTVTEFMATNLKNMNLQVGDSVKLLTTNVQQGGQSIGGLATQLNTLQQLSGGSAQTNVQGQQKFIATSGLLTQAGIAGDVSGAQAIQLGQWFQQKTNGQVDPLATAGQDITNKPLGSLQFQGLLASLPGMLNDQGGAMPSGTLPQAAIQTSGNNLSGNIEKAYQYIASQAGTGPNAPVIFQSMMANFGYSMGLTEATQLLARFRGPQADRPNEKATAVITEAQKTVLNNKERANAALPEYGLFANETQTRMSSDQQKAAKGKYSNPELDALVQKYGAGDVVVFDPQGNPHKIDYNDQSMMEGLGKGTWTLGVARSDAEKKAMEGSNWATGASQLKSKSESLGKWNSGVNPPGDILSSGAGGGTIGLTPEAAKLVTFLPNSGTVDNSTPTTDANAGQNGATPQSNPSIPSGGYGH